MVLACLSRVARSSVVVLLVGPSTAVAHAQNAPFPPPTRLWAAQTSPTQITLSWRKVPGAVRYRLYGMDGSTARPIGQTQASGDRFVRHIVDYNLAHVYAIESVAENATISERVRFNAVVPVRATPGPVAAPASVTAEPLGAGVIAVRWSPVPGATAYMIGRAVSPGGNRLICSLCPATATYLDSATTPGATHVYTVVALTPGGPSRPARSGAATPQGRAVAAAPTAATPDAAGPAAAPKGTIRATPRPGSCLSLGAEGNFIVRLAEGSVRIYERIQFRPRGPSHPKDPRLEPVSGISDAVAVATSGEHWLVLRSDGTILSWGASNTLGQLGRLASADRRFETASRPSLLTPGPVREITNAVAIAAGAEHSVALLADGTIRTWGTGAHGVPGDGSPVSTNRVAPTQVVGIDNAVAVAAGGHATFALLADGTIRAWGWNRLTPSTLGALGVGTDAESTAVPLPVAGITNAIGVAAGSAVVLADGTVRAWGFGYGPSPRRGLPASNTPLPMDGIRDAVAISPYMALLRDGTVREFGAREWPWSTPKLSGVVAIASNAANRFALLADGKLMAWGHRQWYPNGPILHAELGAETARQCAASGRSGS